MVNRSHSKGAVVFFWWREDLWGGEGGGTCPCSSLARLSLLPTACILLAAGDQNYRLCAPSLILHNSEKRVPGRYFFRI